MLESALIRRLRAAARPLDERDDNFDALLDRVGDARFVLIGEASHGTDDFYRMRAEITRRLIEEKGFIAVAAEADWPDAYRVTRFLRGEGDDDSPAAALTGFERFPTWMWRNTVVVEFLDWLKSHNERHTGALPRAGFYGLDLYSLFTSIQSVLKHLSKVDPEAAVRARERYACFDHFGEDTQGYGYAATFGIEPSCEEDVLRQLVEMQQRSAQARGNEDVFDAEQNARLVRDAEEYYRSMFFGHVSSWNLRDRHMIETLEALSEHLERKHSPAKIVVWAHNSHVGDARATEMGAQGEWNVGQLARERFGHEQVYIVGFTTHSGTVTAAPAWDAAAERKFVRPSLPSSWERLFHEVERPRFALDLRNAEVHALLSESPRLERAIGVIYLPDRERGSHYFRARIADQFDYVIHIDRTNALEPLERGARWLGGEAPETYPFAV